jgi:uncharacterized protein (TIGR00255 family)
MIQSMTGYAAATAESARGTLALELRSVNSRFLDVQMRIAEDLRALEPMLRERIGESVARGKVDCRMFFVEGSAPATELNESVLAQLKTLSTKAQKAFPKAEGLRVADVLRWPGVVGGSALDERELRSTAEKLCRRALDELVAARSREGAKLAVAVAERIAAMRERVEAVAPLMPQSVAAYRAKLTERLKEAIGSALGSADDDRVRAEVALFAQKVDVDEELTRLRAHFSEVDRVLQKGGVAGKRLDFLAQELNREANTVASKAASQPVTEAALELKLLVEQMREQVQNIE